MTDELERTAEDEDEQLAARARLRADAWARSVPGTPYGTTTPKITGQITDYQLGHPHEFPGER